MSYFKKVGSFGPQPMYDTKPKWHIMLREKNALAVSSDGHEERVRIVTAICGYTWYWNPILGDPLERRPEIKTKKLICLKCQKNSLDAS